MTVYGDKCGVAAELNTNFPIPRNILCTALVSALMALPAVRTFPEVNITTLG